MKNLKKINKNTLNKEVKKKLISIKNLVNY